MKLMAYAENQEERLGIVTPQGVLDVSEAGRALGYREGELPSSVMGAIEGGEASVAALRELTGRARSHSGRSAWLRDESALNVLPCVARPSKILCVGLNYRKHAEETNSPIPAYPILFSKFHNALAGHGQDVALPRASSKVDYEAELAIVIGKKTKEVSKEDALKAVFGYCCANDLSARDLQMRTPQWLLGKSCDGFGPLGPYLVTADEVGDPNALNIRCAVNGEERQSSNTSDMIFGCDEIVSYVSRHMTLFPGDVILTGTPEGVVLGYPEQRQAWLKDGDIVTVEIDKLGKLTNRMIAEAEAV